MTLIERIRELVNQGVLGDELCPEIDYWHWPVRQPGHLPGDLYNMYRTYGEVRWYGH